MEINIGDQTSLSCLTGINYPIDRIRADALGGLFVRESSRNLLRSSRTHKETFLDSFKTFWIIQNWGFMAVLMMQLIRFLCLWRAVNSIHRVSGSFTGDSGRTAANNCSCLSNRQSLWAKTEYLFSFDYCKMVVVVHRFSPDFLLFRQRQGIRVSWWPRS